MLASEGGEPRLIPNLPAGYLAIQWSSDGQALFIREPGPALPTIERVDVRTGRRQVWAKVQVPDPAGVTGTSLRLITPDGGTYCYNYARVLSELFLAEGLR